MPTIGVEISGVEISIQLRTFKLEVSNMVLEVNWLSQFGPVFFDFIQGYQVQVELRNEAVIH